MKAARTERQQQLKTLLPLLIMSIICIIAITVTYEINKEKIAANKKTAALQNLTAGVRLQYDNDLLSDKLNVAVPKAINPLGNITAYRARYQGQPTAVGLVPVMSKGYNGYISLIIWLAYDGTIINVKIQQHQETEGFGANAHQDNSDWLERFSGYNTTIPQEQWAAQSSEVDQLSGATITAESINRMLYQVLEYYQQERALFYQ